MSGWPSGLRRCVQVAVSSGGVGSNPTSDKHIVFVQVKKLDPVLSSYFQCASLAYVQKQHTTCQLDSLYFFSLCIGNHFYI